MSQKKAAHENPLIPNARLRQIYRAILRAHLLGQALPPAQRSLTAGREAALVSTSIDLASRDLVLDAFSSPVLDFLRGMPLHRIDLAGRPVPRAGSASMNLKSSPRILADSGSSSRLAAIPGPAARIHVALGAAAALKASATFAKKSAKQSASSAQDSAVVLVYVLPGEVSPDTWKSALPHSAQHDLPILFVVLPPIAPRKPARRSAKSLSQIAIDLRAIAHRAGVPAIPVDAADAVALYRAAQESIGHARIGGGPAIIQCISFPESPGPAPLTAALRTLQQYILHRGIATPRWMERESAAFAAHLRNAQRTSR